MPTGINLYALDMWYNRQSMVIGSLGSNTVAKEFDNPPRMWEYSFERNDKARNQDRLQESVKMFDQVVRYGTWTHLGA